MIRTSTITPPGGATKAPLLERVGEIHQVLLEAPSVSVQRIQMIGQEFHDRYQTLRGTTGTNAFDLAAQATAKSHKITQEQARADGAYLRDRPLLDATKALVASGVESRRYALSFVYAAVLQDEKNRTMQSYQQLSDRTHAVSRLCLPGESETVNLRVPRKGLASMLPEKKVALDVPSNHLFLLRNTRENWIRLLTGCEIPYDDLHRRGMYLFTNRNESTPFAHEMVSYLNGPQHKTKLIENKTVLEIGAGNGADPEHYLKVGNAQSVTVLDGSEEIYDHLADRKAELPERYAKKLELLQPLDMFEAFAQMQQQGRKFDTIVSHSSIHYFDDETLEKLFELIAASTKADGHFAFCVKAPGAMLDGNGISLINDSEPHQYKPDQEYVRMRMWMNHDGQMRAFRSHERWEKLIGEHFRFMRRTEGNISDYETHGQGDQKFYTFICQPKNRD